MYKKQFFKINVQNLNQKISLLIAPLRGQCCQFVFDPMTSNHSPKKFFKKIKN